MSASLTPSQGDFTKTRIWDDGRKAIPVGRVGRSWVKVRLGSNGEIAHTRVGTWLEKQFERKRLAAFKYTSVRGESVRGVERLGGLEIEVDGVVIWKSRKRMVTR